MSLLVAAGRLKIEELKNFAATQAMNQIDGDNALEILKLSNKYEHNELWQKAVDEIRKRYHKKIFKDEHAMAPELVENIIENFKKKEEAVKKIEKMKKKIGDEFENELLLNGFIWALVHMENYNYLRPGSANNLQKKTN